MKELGHNTPYKIINMANDYRISDCLVTFLQEKHSSFISELLSRKLQLVEFKKLLNNQNIEKEFKQWMEIKSGNKAIVELLPDNDVMQIADDNLEVDIKYDAKELDVDKLSLIKEAVQDAIGHFKEKFGIYTPEYIPKKINVFTFNTKDNYGRYLKELNIDAKDNLGLTHQGCGSEINVYFYLQNQFSDSCKTLRHEIGHALTIINSYWGAGDALSESMHEGIANYIAGLKDNKHINDHGDIEALSVIQKRALEPYEIFRNNYQGEHYYSEAEQVIKFLEDKHPDLLDNLLKNLASRYVNKNQGKKLVDDFMKTLKDFDSEFKEWVDIQINNNEDDNTLTQHIGNIEGKVEQDFSEVQSDKSIIGLIVNEAKNAWSWVTSSISGWFSPIEGKGSEEKQYDSTEALQHNFTEEKVLDNHDLI